jgi:hypothetical protein
MIRDWVPLLVEEVITDNCGEVVDDDDALACVAEETIEAIDDVTLVVFFVDSSAPLSTILKNISNSLSSLATCIFEIVAHFEFFLQDGRLHDKLTDSIFLLVVPRRTWNDRWQ